MNVRFPCVAGQFYEGDRSGLLRQVKECLPKNVVKRPVRGAVVPHAGLMYSGGVAGEVYAALHGTPTVILLGPNHTGEGKPLGLSSAAYWRTPLGDVEIDRTVSKHLLRGIAGLEEDEEAHRFEHSLEVQLPFLQIVSEGTKIVPICLGFGTPETYKTFGARLAEVLSAFKEEICVIASSDMTHYESHESAKQKDHYAIQAILSIDPDELSRRVKERRISMCGFAPVIAMLAYARQRGALQGELLRYRTSGDASGDYSSVVGYAAILVP